MLNPGLVREGGLAISPRSPPSPLSSRRPLARPKCALSTPSSFSKDIEVESAGYAVLRLV